MEERPSSRPLGKALSPLPLSLLLFAFLLLICYFSSGVRLPREFLLRGGSLSVSKACEEEETTSPYLLLLRAASLIPASHYALMSFFAIAVYLYRFLEIHLLHDLLFTGFRGDSVCLTFHPTSHFYHSVVSKCKILHGRYLATPWISSPHLQTAFLGYIGGNPVINYKREIFRTLDGGTISLDWLRNSDVMETHSQVNDSVQNETTPIVVMIPGITSDSDSPYIKHLAFKIAERAWNVCVVNHRGFGRTVMTSDCFHNGGWTEDIRKVAGHLHSEYPKAPLYAVGISVGANILVKYLGEDGSNAPVAGAAAICSPWDNLLVDRFLNRKYLQSLYSKAITNSLKRYVEWHQAIFSRLANLEGIRKSCSLREFDGYATSRLGKYKTVDTYYRHSSSVNFLESIAVPLLAISSLDDPICPVEAIPWDECRENENIVLATTAHGGHVAYYEGVKANSLWWVRAVDEFLGVLDSSQFVQRKKMPVPTFSTSGNSSNDQVLNLQNEMVKTAGSAQQTIQF